MITFIVIFLSFISTALLSAFTPLIRNWYHFYWLFVFFIGSFVVFTILSILLLFVYSLFVKTSDVPNEKYSKAARFVMDEYLRFVCLFLFRVKVVCRGEELIPKDTRFLMVSNHVSNFDPLITNAYFRGKEISWVAKKSLFRVPVAKAFMYKCCFLSMDRADVRQSLKIILKAVEYLKKDMVSIGIYPEGTRNKNAEESVMLPFKPGALKIAQKANVPIVVMTIANTEKVGHRAPFRSTKVYIDIIKVYTREECEERKTNDLSDEMEALMKANLQEARKRKI